MESSDDLDACVSAPSSNHSEPRKRWYHDWARSIFTIKGRNVQLSKQLTERNRDALGQCVAVIMGNDSATNDQVVLKIRYESVPILNHKSPDSTKHQF